MKTIYTPIAVSSGELPEREKGKDYSVNVALIWDDVIEVGYYHFTHKIFDSFQSGECKPELWLKKEEVPELTEEEKPNNRAEIKQLAWKEWQSITPAPINAHTFVDGYLRGYQKAESILGKVEVKWEENTNTPK